MDKKEERFRNAEAALHDYMENPDNPLDGAEFVKLVDEMFAAKDDLMQSRKRVEEAGE